MQSSGIAMVLPKLKADETLESIEAWKVQTKSYLRAMPAFQPYVDITWTAKKENSSRGFVDGTAVGDPPVVPPAEQAATKNSTIDHMMDMIASNTPEIPASK